MTAVGAASRATLEIPNAALSELGGLIRFPGASGCLILGNRTKMTGDWLAWCAACPVPEIAKAFKRARIDFHQVTGTLLDNDPVWAELDKWIEAARVAHIAGKLKKLAALLGIELKTVC